MQSALSTGTGPVRYAGDSLRAHFLKECGSVHRGGGPPSFCNGALLPKKHWTVGWLPQELTTDSYGPDPVFPRKGEVSGPHSDPLG